MSENKRIESLREALGLNKKSFSEVLGYSTPQSYTNYINRNRSVSIKMLRALTEYNKLVNINWILTGEGDMFLKGTQSSSNINTSGSSRNSTCADVESLKDKIELLEKSLKDKEEIIRLMKNQR